MRSCQEEEEDKGCQWKLADSFNKLTALKTALNRSYIIWVLLADSAIAACGAGKVDSGAIIIILNLEVWETIDWCPVEGNIRPQMWATSLHMEMCILSRYASISPVPVNHPPDSTDSRNDSN